MHNLMTMLHAENVRELAWVMVGLFGQLMFSMRFIVQWLASERAGHSVVPIAFWYFSIIGSVVVLAYGIFKADPVIIVGQLPGVFIYSRNLWLIHAEKHKAG